MFVSIMTSLIIALKTRKVQETSNEMRESDLSVYKIWRDFLHEQRENSVT